MCGCFKQSCRPVLEEAVLHINGIYCNAYVEWLRHGNAVLVWFSQNGKPEEFYDLVIRNLNTDYTANRMIGYLSRYTYLPDLDVTDEMLAIVSDRNTAYREMQ